MDRLCRLTVSKPLAWYDVFASSKTFSALRNRMGAGSKWPGQNRHTPGQPRMISIRLARDRLDEGNDRRVAQGVLEVLRDRAVKPRPVQAPSAKGHHARSVVFEHIELGR